MVKVCIWLEVCTVVGFFQFFSKCSLLFGMPKIDVGVDLSNFLSNQRLFIEMSFVGVSQKVT